MKSLLIHLTEDEYKKLRELRKQYNVKSWKELLIKMLDSQDFIEKHVNNVIANLYFIDMEIIELIRVIILKFARGEIERDFLRSVLVSIIKKKSK